MLIQGLSIGTTIFSIFLWTALTAVAEPPTRWTEPLYAGLVPGAVADEEGDLPQLIFSRVRSDQPTPAVVIFPGGGYGGHAINHEGHEIAQWMASLGVTTAICTYRLRGKGNRGLGYGHPYPMNDAQQAIRVLRHRSDELNIDPSRIGVIGFSAGGHLAATVSTLFAPIRSESEDPIQRISSRPDFSILCYGVLSMGKPFTHPGSQRNLLGTDPDPDLVKLLDSATQITEQTPPTFLFHTAEDKVVPLENSLRYARLCVANGVPVDLHVFQAGRHGIGLGRDVAGASQWPQLCENWLRGLGVVP